MYHHAKLKIWLTRLETYIFCSILQCHNIVNSKTLLLQFLSYVQETKYCVAGKQADIYYLIPRSLTVNRRNSYF